MKPRPDFRTFRLGEARALLDKFADDLRARGFSARSIRDYPERVGQFIKFVDDAGTVERLADITSAHVREYQTALSKRQTKRGARVPLSMSMIHTLLVALRTFFRFLVRTGFLLADPSSAITFPKKRRNPPRYVPTESEVAVLIASYPNTPIGLRGRAMAELFYGSAIRCAELCALGVRDVDVVEGIVRVRRGKGGRDRVVPCGERAAAAVREYTGRARARWIRTATDVLFLTVNGRALDVPTVDRMFREACARAGLMKKITPHCLRHACATHMLKGGANLRHVQEQLGHASLSTTQVYTRLEITDLKRVHERTHPRERDIAEAIA